MPHRNRNRWFKSYKPTFLVIGSAVKVGSAVSAPVSVLSRIYTYFCNFGHCELPVKYCNKGSTVIFYCRIIKSNRCHRVCNFETCWCGFELRSNLNVLELLKFTSATIWACVEFRNTAKLLRALCVVCSHEYQNYKGREILHVWQFLVLLTMILLAVHSGRFSFLSSILIGWRINYLIGWYQCWRPI